MMVKGKVNNGVEEITEQDFAEVVSKPVALVDFFAEWCMPCLMMAPVIEELADKIKEVKFAKVNVDENSGLSNRFKVMSIPTLIIFKDGKEVERIIGSQQADSIEEKLKKYFK
jgi:thioredoxin 1